MPALDWDLRSQDRGGTLVAIVDDLHQVATLLGGKPGHGPIVDYEQLYPGELGEQPGGLAVDAGEGEFVEKPATADSAPRTRHARLGCRWRKRGNSCRYRLGPGSERCCARAASGRWRGCGSGCGRDRAVR